MGKGDKYRPVDKEKYDKNYERIFGEGAGQSDRGGAPRRDQPAPDPNQQGEDEC